jgi:Lar family restriction alleviation protein
MSGELKSCPFCGGRAQHSMWSIHDYHRIACDGCEVEMDYFLTKTAACRWWNTRTEAPGLNSAVTSGWTSIERQLPGESEAQYLCATTYGIQVCNWSAGMFGLQDYQFQSATGEDVGMQNMAGTIFIVTHWMMLPAAPCSSDHQTKQPAQ